MLSSTITPSSASLCRFAVRTLTTRIDCSQYLSPLSLSRKPSPIRALQPMVGLPGMISLGGGMPNPLTFPFQRMTMDLKPATPNAELGSLVLEGKALDDALQYSATDGLPALLMELSIIQEKEHGKNTANSLLCVTNGSQDGLTKAFEMLLSKDTPLLLEDPTYSGVLSFLQPFGCPLVSVATDGQGLIPSSLESILDNWTSGKKPKVLYTIPTGSNPSGGSLTLDRKKEVLRIASKHNLLVLEDDPYYYLSFNPRVPSMFSLDTEGRVLRFDSFSKTLSSGLRLGFVTGPPVLIERLGLHSQATLLHASGVSQAIVASLLRRWREAKSDGFEMHIQNICKFYRAQRDACVTAAQKHLHGLASWSVPEAGMFLWIRLNGVEDSMRLIKEEAVKNKVLMVPGSAFKPDGSASPFVRAAYSTASPEQMETAFQRLGSMLKKL